MGNGMAGGERKVKTYVGEAGKSASVCFYTGGGWKAGKKVIIKAVRRLSTQEMEGTVRPQQRRESGRGHRRDVGKAR